MIKKSFLESLLTIDIFNFTVNLSLKNILSVLDTKYIEQNKRENSIKFEFDIEFSSHQSINFKVYIYTPLEILSVASGTISELSDEKCHVQGYITFNIRIVIYILFAFCFLLYGFNADSNIYIFNIINKAIVIISSTSILLMPIAILNSRKYFYYIFVDYTTRK